ncbi:EAL domain-containing protein [Neptunomonas antarctica]|uniref:PAS domain S-box-containing protein/diguanylate cyclase (GGDEF) domain-containing protein n=1 Tax=Neptunomonas antarctica TaxID=619304 RepID=A0A1N7N4H9_9GAMM|nr:EAL domain-containing protein [Neptunomonas antarctica]SIS93287.1 PAS domain S-box-containing protein/diguanylate cyclase (GGDEF) domain-containing protein [Neptunomonas antarctica]
MKEAITTSDALLQRLSNQRRQRLRKNVYILFLGLRAEESGPIISLLRGARFAPRGRQLNTESEFSEALSERSWDVIICASEHEDFAIKQAMHHLKRLDKDIPVIQLVPHANSHILLQGFKANMQAVVPVEEKELLLATIRRELEHLENRRRMRQAESLLTEAEKRGHLLMECSTLAIAYFDAERLLLANNAFAMLFGYDDAEKLEGKSIDQFVTQQDTNELYEQVRHFAEKNLTELIFQLTGRRADDSNFKAQIELKETRINRKSCVQVIVRPGNQHQTKNSFTEHDPITGLYNSELLQRRLDATIQAALPGGNDCHLFYLSLNNFTQIRSEYGNDSCDHIVRDLTDILKAQINPVHTKGRLSDDCFAVIFQDPRPEMAVSVAEDLCKAITKHTSTVNSLHINITCSIGITTITDTSPGTPELIARAKTAADTVRSKHKDGVLFYTPDSPPSEQADSEALQSLRSAIEQQQFKLLFQPIVPLSYNSTINHYEALLRLLDANRKELLPSLFLETMESAELGVIMDRWVILDSIRHLHDELKKSCKHRLFISVTKQTWRDPDILSLLSEQLRKFRIPADHLVFQISESDCASNLADARAFAEGLKKLHCLICIKHYGCSNNANHILRKIGADYVKLDGSFVQELGSAHALDVSFEEMAEELKSQGKITIAPLVEDTKVMSRLWKSGIGLIQGYYLQPPREKMDYDFFDNQ